MNEHIEIDRRIRALSSEGVSQDCIDRALRLVETLLTKGLIPILDFEDGIAPTEEGGVSIVLTHNGTFWVTVGICPNENYLIARYHLKNGDKSKYFRLISKDAFLEKLERELDAGVILERLNSFTQDGATDVALANAKKAFNLFFYDEDEYKVAYDDDSALEYIDDAINIAFMTFNYRYLFRAFDDGRMDVERNMLGFGDRFLSWDKWKFNEFSELETRFLILKGCKGLEKGLTLY